MDRLQRWWRRYSRLARAWIGQSATMARLDYPMAAGARSSAPSAIDSRQRLRRLLKQYEEGQSAAVELELHQWHRETNCPIHARLLLAGLLARRGEHAQARSVLAVGLAHDPDADALVGQMLVSLFVADDLLDAAQHAVAQLYSHHGHDPQIAQWISCLSLPGQDTLAHTPQAVVDYLASELLCAPQMLATLATAMEIRKDPGQVAMIRRAGRLLWPDMNQGRWGIELCQAMTRLAILAHDQEDARQWITRGLEIDPYNAVLALSLSKLRDDPARGPTSIDILAAAVAAHPDYPDLHIALIRRQLQMGRIDSARRDWRLWCDRHPGHPLAMELAQQHKELAA